MRDLGFDQCHDCGGTYSPTTNNQLYCSPLCRRRTTQPTSTARTIPQGHTCRYRECGQQIIRALGKCGPLPSFCNNTHRRHERSARDADLAATKTPVPRAAPKPRPRKYSSGDVFGELTLIEYVERSRTGDSRGRFSCSCGTVKELRFSNVVNCVTTHCADRTKHPRNPARNC